MKKKAKSIKLGKGKVSRETSGPKDTFTPDLPKWEEVEEKTVIAAPVEKPKKIVVRALTSKQEDFAVHVADGKNQTEAFRLVYKIDKSKPESIHRNAKKLMDNVKIVSRIEELRAPVVEKLQIDNYYLLSSVKEVVGRCMQAVPVMQGGKPVIIETKDGELAPAYTFNPKGALQGLDMLYKHKGLYEKDNRQQQTLAGMSVNVRFVDAPEQ